MSLGRRVHLKTFVMIVLMVLFGPMGDVLLGKGMKESGGVPLTSFASVADGISRGFRNEMVWLGLLSLIIFFVCYLLVLSWADYSFVSPASAVSYAVVTFFGWTLLGESVTSIRWLGVAVICLGVFLVGQTPPRTTAGVE
jgi:multidrug transporter EmrE-like cation transporter